MFQDNIQNKWAFEEKAKAVFLLIRDSTLFIKVDFIKRILDILD